jgi:hypothetical protein
VTFDFGPIGRHTAQYTIVQVEGRLVNTANPIDDPLGSYAPPDNDAPFMLQIDGYPAVLPVMLVGTYPLLGHTVTTYLVVSIPESA